MKQPNEAAILARGRARRALRQDPDLARLTRVRAGLTQADVAELVGADRSAIARWELGARVPQGALLDRYRGLLEKLSGGSDAA